VHLTLGIPEPARFDAQLLEMDSIATVEELAAAENMNASYLSRVLRFTARAQTRRGDWTAGIRRS
jgi:hypothetical protein